MAFISIANPAAWKNFHTPEESIITHLKTMWNKYKAEFAPPCLTNRHEKKFTIRLAISLNLSEKLSNLHKNQLINP